MKQTNCILLPYFKPQGTTVKNKCTLFIQLITVVEADKTDHLG